MQSGGKIPYQVTIGWLGRGMKSAGLTGKEHPLDTASFGVLHNFKELQHVLHIHFLPSTDMKSVTCCIISDGILTFDRQLTECRNHV